MQVLHHPLAPVPDRVPRARRFAGAFTGAVTIILLLVTIAPRVASADEIVVIVNKDNPNQVDRAFVQRIYTGAVKGWPDGTPVFALDQAEGSAAREQFGSKLLGKSQANLRAIWSQNIFTGKGYPPRLAAPDEQMKRLVANNRNAIGYVFESSLDDSVRALR